MCANQQGGVRSRCPRLTAPLPKQAAEAGVGAAAVLLLPIMHGGGWAMGQEEEGWRSGASLAPHPLPPWRLCGQDSEAGDAREWPLPCQGAGPSLNACLLAHSLARHV